MTWPSKTGICSSTPFLVPFRPVYHDGYYVVTLSCEAQLLSLVPLNRRWSPPFFFLGFAAVLAYRRGGRYQQLEQRQQNRRERLWIGQRSQVIIYFNDNSFPITHDWCINSRSQLVEDRKIYVRRVSSKVCDLRKVQQRPLSAAPVIDPNGLFDTLLVVALYYDRHQQRYIPYIKSHYPNHVRNAT